MLFATQNPPGAYGGRKVLSRAFRNRFLELHVGDIPDEELVTILQQRCQARLSLRPGPNAPARRAAARVGREETILSPNDRR